MNSANLLAQKLKSIRQTTNHVAGLIGNMKGEIMADEIRVFVRLANGQTIIALNRHVPPVYDTPVVVSLEKPYHILYMRESYTVPQHSAQHAFPGADVVFVDRRDRTAKKTVCQYCKSSAPDDERGNCSACGAPRSQ